MINLLNFSPNSETDKEILSPKSPLNPGNNKDWIEINQSEFISTEPKGIMLGHKYLSGTIWTGSKSICENFHSTTQKTHKYVCILEPHVTTIGPTMMDKKSQGVICFKAPQKGNMSEHFKYIL